MAAMLSKFRIDYSDVIVITDITKKPADSTRAYFDSLTKKFMKNEDDEQGTSYDSAINMLFSLFMTIFTHFYK